MSAVVFSAIELLAATRLCSKQHKRDAHAHAFDCKTCDHHFGSQEALDQHLRDSPSHAPSLDFKSCTQSFGSQAGTYVGHHVMHTLMHNPPKINEFFSNWSPISNYD